MEGQYGIEGDQDYDQELDRTHTAYTIRQRMQACIPLLQGVEVLVCTLAVPLGVFTWSSPPIVNIVMPQAMSVMAGQPSGGHIFLVDGAGGDEKGRMG